MRQKIQKIGASMFVRIPLDWKRDKHLAKGSVVDVREDPEGNLLIIPCAEGDFVGQ